MIPLIIFVTLTLVVLLFKKQHFILWIPVFTLLVDAITIVLSDFQLGIANYSVILLEYFRVLIFIAVSLIILRKYYSKQLLLPIIYFIIFLLAKSITTIDPYNSLKVSLSLSSYILLLSASFSYFKGIGHFEGLVNVLRLTLLLYLLNTVVFSYLGIGFDFYGQTNVYQGSIPLFTAYGIMYTIILLFVLQKRTKIIDTFLMLSNSAILILMSKRASILLLILGVSIIVILNRKIYFRSSNFIYFAILLAFVLSVFYLSFVQAMETRTRVSEFEIAEEGRYLEYVILYGEVIESNDLLTFLFGKELFVEEGQFGLNQSILEVSARRIHSDYAILLYGGGLVGLLLYLRLFYIMFKTFLTTRDVLKGQSKYRAAFLAIFICLIFNGFVDSLTVASARAIPFVFLGGLLGVLFSYQKKGIYETSIV